MNAKRKVAIMVPDGVRRDVRDLIGKIRRDVRDGKWCVGTIDNGNGSHCMVGMIGLHVEGDPRSYFKPRAARIVHLFSSEIPERERVHAYGAVDRVTTFNDNGDSARVLAWVDRVEKHLDLP